MDELDDVDDDLLDNLLLVSSTRVSGVHFIQWRGGLVFHWVMKTTIIITTTRVSNCDALVGWRRMTPQHHQK